MMMLRPGEADLLSHLLPASIPPGTNLLAIKPWHTVLAILAWHALRTDDSVRPFRQNHLVPWRNPFLTL